MTDDVLTPALPTEGLSAEDAAVFERVWHRVMAGREQEQTALVPTGQPPAPPAPVGQTDGLLEQLRAHTTGWRATQSLARKAGGSMARVLSGMAADERRHAKRLSTAYFLITGERYQSPNMNGTRPPMDLMTGLREQFIQEQRGAAAYQGAAQETTDPCLRQLYQEIAREEQAHARMIRNLLEQM